MKDIKGIIFDLFGTLIEIQDKRMPYKQIIPYVSDDLKKNIMTRNFSVSDLDILPHIKELFYNDLNVELNSTFVMDGTIQVLESLSKKYPLFLLSNLATPYKEIFNKFDIDKYFTKTFFSCDIGKIKPTPECYNEVIKYSKLLPHNLIMIGDSYKSDYCGAMSVGINAILKTQPLIETVNHFFY